MSKQWILPIIIGFTMACYFSPEVWGQGGSAKLPRSRSKPKPKPTPKIAPTPLKEELSVSPRAPINIQPIAFNQLITANLDPRASGQIKVGIYYDEYTLKASAADVFTIFLKTPNPALSVQVYSSEGQGLPILKDPRTGEFKLDTQDGTLPSSGEYRIRVVGVVSDFKRGPIGYTLKINRTGLTEAGYKERIQFIVPAFDTLEAKNIDEIIVKLEQLANEDESRPGAYELLGAIYLYHRNNVDKAIDAMERAIKRNGAAVFRVTYDSVLGRRPQKKSGGQYDWVQSRPALLRIQPGYLSLIDAMNEQQYIFSLSGSQIKEVGIEKVAATMTVIQLKVINQSKPYAINPKTRTQAELDLILKMIRTYASPRG